MGFAYHNFGLFEYFEKGRQTKVRFLFPSVTLLDLSWLFLFHIKSSLELSF